MTTTNTNNKNDGTEDVYLEFSYPHKRKMKVARGCNSITLPYDLRCKGEPKLESEMSADEKFGPDVVSLTMRRTNYLEDGIVIFCVDGTLGCFDYWRWGNRPDWRREEIKLLSAKARSEGMWLYDDDWHVWMSPDELDVEIYNPEFNYLCWDWEIRNPLDRVNMLNRQINQAIEIKNDILSMLDKQNANTDYPIKIELRLFVIGETSGNKSDWVDGNNRVLVMASSLEEAFSVTYGYSCGAEVIAKHPTVICGDAVIHK